MKECNSLAEVREEIDKLDDMIVELIAKRNKYIKQAARFKNTIDTTPPRYRSSARPLRASTSCPATSIRPSYNFV